MTETFGLSQAALDILCKALGKFAEIEDAYIFGSRAMGNYRTGSDIDLAIFGQGVSETTVRRLSVLLNEESPLPYRVDVVAFDLCENAALKEHIVRHGRPLGFERGNHTEATEGTE
jgi:predicted nucleotidyltransferase